MSLKSTRGLLDEFPVMIRSAFTNIALDFKEMWKHIDAIEERPLMSLLLLNNDLINVEATFVHLVKTIKTLVPELEMVMKRVEDDAVRSVVIKKSKQVTLAMQAKASGERQKSKKLCCCGQPDETDLVACEGSDCSIEWFHLKCVGLSRIPDNDWYCDKCRKEMNK